MGKLSQKLFPAEELRERVTIRVLPEKMQIYPRFKELVCEQLGSDVCFVTTSLWEAFLQAMDENPPADQPIEMKFLRQNVQINIGCQILYQPKKARRSPPGTHLGDLKSFPFYIDKHNEQLLPQILDQWKTMKPEAQKFWRIRLQEAGIMPAHEEPPAQPLPSVSTPAHDKPLKKIFKTLYNSMTNVTGWIRRKLWSE